MQPATMGSDGLGRHGGSGPWCARQGALRHGCWQYRTIACGGV